MFVFYVEIISMMNVIDFMISVIFVKVFVCGICFMIEVSFEVCVDRMLVLC